MDPGKGHQIGLEFVHVNIQLTFETQRRSHAARYFAYQPVQVVVTRVSYSKLLLTQLIDRFVVQYATDFFLILFHFNSFIIYIYKDNINANMCYVHSAHCTLYTPE